LTISACAVASTMLLANRLPAAWNWIWNSPLPVRLLSSPKSVLLTIVHSRVPPWSGQ
jgi:hypothetical protein